jgi:hypothetical protein
MTIYTFPIPVNLDGEQLRAELKADSVYVADNLLYVVGNLTEDQIKTRLAAHRPIIAPDKSADKAALLAKLGITADEAKLLFN